jgi:hypothetical protein
MRIIEKEKTKKRVKNEGWRERRRGDEIYQLNTTMLLCFFSFLSLERRALVFRFLCPLKN